MRATPILCAPRLAHILRENEARLRNTSTASASSRTTSRPCAQEAPACQWKGCKRAGAAPRARGARARGPVLSALPRARAPVQCLLQLLRRHEQRRDRGLPEGQRHRPPSDLEGGRQRLGARHAPRRSGATRAAMARRFADPHAFFSWRAARTARRRASAPRAQAAGAEVAGIPQFDRRRRPQSRSRRGSRSWSSATTPTPTAGTSAPRTSCAKSSKPITI